MNYSIKFIQQTWKKLKDDKNITASSFKHMESPSHKYPQQSDSFNCGVVALWYNLFFLKERATLRMTQKQTLQIQKSMLDQSDIRCYYTYFV